MVDSFILIDEMKLLSSLTFSELGLAAVFKSRRTHT